MEQQTKDQYIAFLKSSSWQDIKEEADNLGVEKDDEQKWKDLIPAIADKKFAAPVETPSDDGFASLSEVEKEFLDAELVTESEEDAIAPEPIIQPEEPVKEPKEVEKASIEPSDEVLRFDYVRQGVTLHCQHCNYEIRVGFSGEKICPVSHPKCPRPSPNEVN